MDQSVSIRNKERREIKILAFGSAKSLYLSPGGVLGLFIGFPLSFPCEGVNRSD
jgi:hypothetical protein